MQTLLRTFAGSTRRTALLLLALGTGLTSAQAEGSKNLTPGTQTIATNPNNGPNDRIGYLQHNDAANSNRFLAPNATPEERLYVHMKTGDTLFYAVHRINSGESNRRLRLQVMDNSGALKSNILTLALANNTNFSFLAAQPGVIDTYAQAQVGPRRKGFSGAGTLPTLPAAGYNPLYYVNTGIERDVWVEFAQLSSLLNSDAVVFLPPNAPSQGTNTDGKSWYDIWDFTVRNSGEKPGRLFAQTWSFTGGDFFNQFSTSFGLFPLIPNPNEIKNSSGATIFAPSESFFVKRVSYARMTPFGVILLANEFGSVSALGRTTFQERRKSQVSNVGYAQYKMFVNNPDPAVYPSTVVPQSPTATATCTPGPNGTNTTVFKLTVFQAGYGIIFIDGNGNGAYETNMDRILEGATVVGDNFYTWDGRSDGGTAITATQLNITYASGVGPVNFPLFDCEAAQFNGITVNTIRPGNQVQDFVYWDDRNLNAAFNAVPYNPDGTNANPGHRWGVIGTSTGNNTGDNILVNTYAVGLLARGQALNISYDPTTACATTPPVTLPVTLTKFEARAEGPAVRLNWETATELNSAYFEVERSLDGRQFEAVGRVAAVGRSSSQQVYSLLDRSAPAAASLLYYRLRQVDTDGTAAYSDVRTVKAAGRPLITGAYPNPTVGTLFVSLAEPLTGAVTLRVLDATGRLMWQQQQASERGQSELRIPTDQLTAGRTYILQVQTNSGSFIQRFVK